MPPKPVATYRLQLRPGFGFEQVLEIVDYLANLGITHLYTSPLLQAATGSTHGYDIVDPTRINTQLGTYESYSRLCETLQKKDLGLMIDVVPNHMAIIGKQNPWWWDVLENGPSSPYAIYFDVDWDASEERWPNKVLLPVLGDHYGQVLDKGELKITFLDGHMILDYHEQSFPIDPSSLAGFFSRVASSSHSELLAFLAESYARLPRPTVTSRPAVERRHKDKAVLFNLLVRLCQEEPESTAAILAEVERLNKDPDALHALLEQQNYRLAFWSTASRDLGYRRFFDIKDLVGMRVEDFEVFQASHALPISWFKKGWVQGLRVDHPDGLRDPAQYFHRLQEACPGSWVVAEKILEPDEELPSSWEVAGTTGYDFLNLVNGLFIDPQGKEALTKIYHDIIGQEIDFKDLVYTCKCLVLEELFGSEVNLLASLFVEICEKHRHYRDYTRHELREALRQVAACFPVYRSYASAKDRFVSDEDKHHIETAIDLAKLRKPDIDPKLLLFLKAVLLLSVEGSLEEEFAMRFQQLTGPVMAKGYEDTALYRYNRLISLNEVGGDPSGFGISLQQFHEACLIARPLSLLASTTHDTKHSEDFRARLSLLSQMPEEWGQFVQRWMNAYPELDRNTAYLFFQALVGTWPINEERMQAYMEKVVREAKEHTSWLKPNKQYEENVRIFVATVMDDKNFIADLETYVAKLLYPGWINGLAQTLIKMTAPGVSDIYQGSELWNTSLVDPDNRREVDYPERIRLLNELNSLNYEEILARMDEGLPKLWVIHKTLHLRQKHPFGPYKPLYAKGNYADHVVAYMRGDSVLIVVPRFDCQDTMLNLPSGNWENIFTGETLSGEIRVEELLARFPIALMLWVPKGS